MLHCVDAFPGPSCPKVDLLLSPKHLLSVTTQYGPPTSRIQGESLKGHGERGGWKTREYVRMIVVLFSLLGDLRNLHSRRGNGQCSDEGYRGCYSGEAMLPSVGWKYSSSLDAEGCPIVPNLLSFLLPLSSPATEISSSVYTVHDGYVLHWF